MNILVLCTGNSARSIMLEALLGQFDGITAFSAGSKPTGEVHPQAIATLMYNKIKLPQLGSKSWVIFAEPDAPQMDIVITVCGNARDEACPIWPGAPITAHWGVEDPAAVTDPIEAVADAFQTQFKILQHRANLFGALDYARLGKSGLQDQLNIIAQAHP